MSQQFSVTVFILGHRFHALLKVYSDHDDTSPLNRNIFILEKKLNGEEMKYMIADLHGMGKELVICPNSASSDASLTSISWISPLSIRFTKPS